MAIVFSFDLSKVFKVELCSAKLEVKWGQLPSKVGNKSNCWKASVTVGNYVSVIKFICCPLRE